MPIQTGSATGKRGYMLRGRVTGNYAPARMIFANGRALPAPTITALLNHRGVRIGRPCM